MDAKIKISESIRQNIINLESDRVKLSETNIGSISEKKLVERIEEYLKAALSIFYSLSEFLFESENCNDESDIELLLTDISMSSINKIQKPKDNSYE